MAIALKEEGQSPRVNSSKRYLKLLAAISILGVSSLVAYPFVKDHLIAEDIERLSESLCPVADTIRPASFIQNRSSADEILYDAEFRNTSLKKFTGALKFPTITYDGMPPITDDEPLWKPFEGLHAYLQDEFPLFHDKLEVEHVNKFGFLYTWKGTDESLKPLLLMAHQDVVPVAEETRKDWFFDPFSGYFDGVNIWSRGAADDKTLLLSYYEAVEKLLTEDFVPKRSVIFAFGFDEEYGGPNGARAIAAIVKERYGLDSIYAIVDEGSNAVRIVDGTPFAFPATGEKGTITFEITLTTPGGHSSVPPDHTNIGIVSKLINYIEGHQFDAILGPNNPTLNQLQCIAKYTDSYDTALKRHIFKAAYNKLSNSKVIKYISQNLSLLSNIRTTQATDIIHGGVKSNALPEFVTFTINHRISVESSVQATIDKISGNVKTIAKDFDLGVIVNGTEVVPKTTNGYFNVIVPKAFLEPPKVSPTDNEVWEIFSGSIKHILEDYIYPNSTKPAVIASSMMNGNTDTNNYSGLTENVYRFTLTTTDHVTESHIHSVNEHLSLDDHLYSVLFVYEYIKSVSEHS